MPAAGIDRAPASSNIGGDAPVSASSFKRNEGSFGMAAGNVAAAAVASGHAVCETAAPAAVGDTIDP